MTSNTTFSRRRVVVCGFGNVLRADDGAGPIAVTCLGRASGGRAVTLTGQQPFPEWSESLAAADVAYFVDASSDSEIALFRATPIDVKSTSPLADPHGLGPAKILDLTALLYHHVPKAYLVEIAARDFGYGQALSACSRIAVRRVTRWLRARLSRRVRFVGCAPGHKHRRRANLSHARSRLLPPTKRHVSPTEQGGDRRSAAG